MKLDSIEEEYGIKIFNFLINRKDLQIIAEEAALTGIPFFTNEEKDIYGLEENGIQMIFYLVEGEEKSTINCQILPHLYDGNLKK